MIADMIPRETAESLELTNSVTIEVGTASYRTSRGYTLAAVLCDEIAFWPTVLSFQEERNGVGLQVRRPQF